LPVLLYCLLLECVFFSALLYYFEPRSQVSSFSEACWLTIVSMTTVGYYTPASPEGYILISLVIVSSSLYMAIPLGIVGSVFSKVWEDRHRLLLMQRTRARILQGGYAAKDIPELFRLFGSEGDRLTLASFRKMLSQMRIGFNEGRIVELFQSFDKDASGTVEPKEFIHALFPGAYAEMYGLRGDSTHGTEILSGLLKTWTRMMNRDINYNSEGTADSSTGW